MSIKNQKAVGTVNSSSANKNVNAENNSSANKIKFSNDVLDAMNALSLTDAHSNHGNKSIFKKEYNDKTLRTKYRNMLIKISKVEIDGGTTEVQKGLVPQMLMQIKKNKIEDALKTFNEISEICKKVYVAEDKFEKAEDYFSGNRSAETQNILKAFILVAQSLNAE